MKSDVVRHALRDRQPHGIGGEDEPPVLRERQVHGAQEWVCGPMRDHAPLPITAKREHVTDDVREPSRCQRVASGSHIVHRKSHRHGRSLPRAQRHGR